MNSSLLLEGDCLDVMKLVPDKSINMVLCDLPYGTTQNSWDSQIPLDKLWAQYKRVLAPNGMIALMCQGIFTAKLIISQEALFKYKIVWVKSKSTNFLNAKKQPLRKHEDICIFYQSQPPYTPQMSTGPAYDKGIRKNQLTGSYGDFKPARIKSEGDRYPVDVVYFKTAEAEGKVWHPTQKPIELGRYLIKTYTQPNDIILDNCFGSGSFLVAAALETRNSIGIEINDNALAFKKKAVNLLEIAMERLSGVADVKCYSKNLISQKENVVIDWLCNLKNILPIGCDSQSFSSNVVGLQVSSQYWIIKNMHGRGAMIIRSPWIVVQKQLSWEFLF